MSIEGNFGHEDFNNQDHNNDEMLDLNAALLVNEENLSAEEQKRRDEQDQNQKFEDKEYFMSKMSDRYDIKKENNIKSISEVNNFSELFEVLRQKKEIVGSQKNYSPEEIIEIIKNILNLNVTQESALINNITRTDGLRDKVKELINKKENIEEDFEEVNKNGEKINSEAIVKSWFNFDLKNLTKDEAIKLYKEKDGQLSSELEKKDYNSPENKSIEVVSVNFGEKFSDGITIKNAIRQMDKRDFRPMTYEEALQVISEKISENSSFVLLGNDFVVEGVKRQGFCKMSLRDSIMEDVPYNGKNFDFFFVHK